MGESFVLLLAYVVLARNLLDVGADLEGESAVEAAGGLVEEEDLGVGDEAAGDAEALLLAAAEALFDGRADDGVRLAVQAEGGDEVVDALDEVGFGDVAVFVVSQSSRTTKTDRFKQKRAHLGRDILAANRTVSRTVRLPISASSCST